MSCFQHCMQKVQEQAEKLVDKQIAEEENLSPEELKQKGKKYLKSQNFDEAAVEFVDAAQKYKKLENDIKNAGLCYQLAGEAQEKLNEQLMAAVYYRDAVNCYFSFNKQQKNQNQDQMISVQEQILPLIQKSSQFFEENGKTTDAAKMFILQSYLIDNKRQVKQLRKKGIDLLLGDNKPVTAGSILVDFIDFLIDNQMFEESIEYIDMAYHIYDNLKGYKFKVNEMLYYKVLISIKIEDYVLADKTLKNQTFQDCEYKDSEKQWKEILEWIFSKCKYSVSNSFTKVYKSMIE